jgi:uncharacterized membrane protein HdeD (DUF308 family)
MAQGTPVDIVRQASTWSILWGVSLIIFGMLAVGSPYVAAVAVNALLAWLIFWLRESWTSFCSSGCAR